MLTFNEVYDPTDERIEKILRAAEKHFQEQGFRKASIDEICKDAGLSKPTFYKHFDSKESLFFAVRIHSSHIFYESYTDAAHKCKTASEKLHLYFKMMEEFSSSEAAFSGTFDYIRELRKNWENHPWCVEAILNDVEFFEKIVLEGIAANEFRTGDPRTIAHKIMASISLLEILRRHPPQFLAKSQSIADLVFDLLLNGIKK